MKKQVYYLLFTLILLIFTSSCSSHISTNLDKDNFQKYFSAATVEIYQHEQDIPTHHQLIGVVEGQDCQEKSHHAEPDKINARTKARQQAFKKQANGIVFTGCAELSSEQLAQLSQSSDAQQCHAITICYGKAYFVEVEASTDNEE